MNRRQTAHALVAAVALAVSVSAWADNYDGIEAEIKAISHNVPPGRPILIDLFLRNTTDHPVVLSVPGVDAEPVTAVMGLPLAHVFSGVGFSGLTVRGDYGHTWTELQAYDPPERVPEIVLGARSVVGTRIDARAYYSALQTAGTYRLVWQPYGGMLTSNQVTIEVAPRKQAHILTDVGAMTIRLKYDSAPNHVANFIELARDGFYNQSTFHRIEQGYFIQGGCPSGDGSGIRPDGRKLRAEFSDTPAERGTVSMALVPGDVDSASCQFIIANTRIREWDGKYTIFGELVGEESFQTLDKLMMTPVEDPMIGRLAKTLYIRAIQIVNAPRDFGDTAPVGRDIRSRGGP